MVSRKSFTWALALLLATSAMAQDMRIQFAEPITLDARAGHAGFTAYGRRFELSLENNERLLKALPAARKAELAGANLLRGSIDGLPGSWVRLARVGQGVEGAVWDGNDLYAITTRARIDSMLTTPLAASASQTVVYRLSDAIGGLGRDFCAAGPDRAASSPGQTPLEKYRGMVRELKMQAASIAPGDQIELSLIGDLRFQAQFGTSSSAELLARLNIVDGIFSGQVGILILATDVRLLPTDPFNTNNPDTLLDQFSNYRDATATVRARGVAHLVTGRDLDGNVNGIGYIGTVCDRKRSVSISDTAWATLTAAQVMAHELGHNFGAQHDGVAGGACASTPPNYLMSPTVNGSGTFSACSLASMAAVIAAARGSCIVPAAYADLAVAGPAGAISADDGSDFVLPLTVDSLGNLPVQQATLMVTVPSGLAFQSGAVAGGSCAAGAGGEVTCTLGTLAPGEARVASLTLSGTTLASFEVGARVAAGNDYLHGNDSTSAAVTVRSGIDVGVAMSSSGATLYATDPVDFTFDVTATRSRAVHGATLDGDLSSMSIDSISAGANSCSLAQVSVHCQLIDLAPGAHTAIVVHAHASLPGDWAQTVYVNVAGDGDSGNNNAHVMSHIQAENGVTITQSSVDFRAALGQSYENTYTLTALGRLSSPDVRFEINALQSGVVEAVTQGSGSCADLGGVFPAPRFRCAFGTLSPGDSRTVVVRFHMDTEGADTLRASSIYRGALQDVYSSSLAAILAAPGDDVAVDVGVGGEATEGINQTGTVSVQSRGINPPQNVVVTLEVSAPLQLTAWSLAGWNCSRPTPQQGRCSIASLPAGPSYIPFQFYSATPGTFQAHVAVTADGDSVSTNDSKDAVIDVLTYLDVGISAAGRDRILVLGTPEDVNLTITSGARPVTGARLTANHERPGWEVVAMSAGDAACSAGSDGYSCDLGDLPANASIPVTVRYNALDPGVITSTPVCVQIPRDSRHDNDCFELLVRTLAMTDIRLQVAQSAVSGSTGSTFHLPLITVVNGAEAAADVHVRVPMPAFATVQTVATSAANCTGSTTLDCDFQQLGPNQSATLDIVLMPGAAGTFTSNIELSAINDSSLVGNTAAVSVTAIQAGSANPGAGSSGGGKGGGGGRTEWLTLALLAMLAARRARGSGAPRRRPR